LVRPHLQFAGSPDVFLRYLLQPHSCVHVPTLRRPKRLFSGSGAGETGARWSVALGLGWSYVMGKVSGSVCRSAGTAVTIPNACGSNGTGTVRLVNRTAS
jgi:hypothetical protein